MKTKHSIWKSKLVKTMSLTTVILVAALFLGTAVSAGLTPQTTPTQKNKVNDITLLSLASTSGVSSASYSQQKESGTMTPTPIVPLGEVIFTQGYYSPDESWNFVTSSTGLGYLVQEDFWEVGDDIGDIEWYGLSLIYSGGWTPGDPTGMTFEIKFYEDNAGAPGAEVASFSDLEPVVVDTGLLYGGYYPMWYWTIVLPSSVSLAAGWVSIQSTYSPATCNFLWAAGPDGNFNALQNGGNLGLNMAYSLTAPDFVYDHDIAISSIVKPATGNAAPITPVVKVKNNGLYTETSVDIQLEIGKELITGTLEDFEATNGGYTHFPKTVDAWEYGAPTSGPMAAHSGSNLWATILGGNYPPSMWCSLVTPVFTVPSGTFSFWHWYNFENGWDGGNVKISTNGVDWTLITPIGNYPGVMSSNPYMNGQAAYTGNGGGWKKAEFDLATDYEGQDVQIMWETASDSSVQYPGWYIDDVGFTITSWVNVYDETVNIPSIAVGEIIELEFPEWTPADLGLVENNNINYFAEATNLFIDENVNNDYKAKAFTLHFGWFNDVKVNAINSPVSGIASPQTPEVAIENVGQFDQSANVNMVISKRQYGSQWQVYNPSGGNTWVRDTLGPRTGTGCAKCTYEYTALPNDDWLATPGNVVAPGGVFSFWVHGYTYNDDSYHVYLSTVGNTIDDFLAGTELFSGIAPPTTYTLKSFDLSAYEGQTVYCAIFYDGNYAWYIWVDDVTLPDGTTEGFEGTAFPPLLVTLIPEYDATTTVDIAAGETMNVSLPEWIPEDLPFALGIDYQADVEVTLNGFTPIWNYGLEDWVPTVPEVPPPFPPAGWAIWNVNGGGTWIRTTSGMHTGSGAAYVSYNYPAPNNDWLATTGTVVAPGGVFSFWLKGYNYNDDTYNVYMSTVGNTVANFQAGTLLASGIAPSAYTLMSFGMSAYVGQTVYYGIQSTGNDAWYLWVDDVTFPDGTTQGFEGTPAIPGHWPDWTQTAYGTDPDNKWLGVTSGSYPTCMPAEGTYMASYQTFFISSGNSNQIVKNTPFDLTAPGVYNLNFQMMHDTGYLTSGDRIYVLASPDGINYYYWTDPIYRSTQLSGLPAGWATHSVNLNGIIDYFGPGYYNIGFYGVSAYGTNIFMDDLSIQSAGDIPDGNPADNTMSKMFTLSYEHDVGVTAITEPSAPPKQDDVIWDNYADDGTGTGLSSQLDVVYPFNSQMADDFQFTTAMDITDVHWWGAFWNGVSGAYPNPCEFNVIFYLDDGSGNMPTGAGMDDPTSTAVAVYNFPAVTGTTYGTDKYEYDVILEPAFVADAGQKYWVAIQAVFGFTGVGQWGWSTNGANPEQLGVPVQGFPLLGTAYWTPQTYGDMAFQLTGIVHPEEPTGNWLPGIYEVAGTVKNLGFVYTESNFDVNTQITNNTNVVVYDETVTVAGPLAPGESVAVTFPDITIENESSAEGTYKVTMKTMLAGDDHPNNDKKTMTFVIEIPDITPPVTTATVAGTMGQLSWYISSVSVTLAAIDPAQAKWPSGVNHTYLKLDSAEYVEVTLGVPFVVTADGQHTVLYYSVDKAGNVETAKSLSFKMDTTKPEWINYSFTALNLLKTKWLCVANVTDGTIGSGIVLVQFFVDDQLVANDTEAPYEFTFLGKPTNTSQALAYDAAGNSKLSSVVVNYEYGSQQQSYPQVIQALKQKNL